MMFPHEHSQVTIKAVLELMILCRGDNQATVEAIAGGFCFLSQEITEVTDCSVKQGAGGTEFARFGSRTCFLR